MSDWSSGIDAAREVIWKLTHDEFTDEQMDEVFRAFLSIQPSIRWCAYHGASVDVDHLHDNKLCRIVERKLVDAPHIS